MLFSYVIPSASFQDATFASQTTAKQHLAQKWRTEGSILLLWERRCLLIATIHNTFEPRENGSFLCYTIDTEHTILGSIDIIWLKIANSRCNRRNEALTHSTHSPSFDQTISLPIHNSEV